MDGEEYQYEELEYEDNDQNSCNSGTECLPLSQCDSTYINSDESPPTYCKDSSATGEDHFCCMKNSNISMPPNQVREQRLFTKFYNTNWRCADHTDMCQTWVNFHPDSCNPESEHYDFMKLACMDTCKVCKDNVSN